MSVTSDEINYLVYRYLLESGFSHSTFAFQYETAIHRADIKGAGVKPGALIRLLQKGLQFVEVETHLKQDGSEIRCTAPFSLLGPHECQIVQLNEQDIIADRELVAQAARHNAAIKKQQVQTRLAPATDKHDEEILKMDIDESSLQVPIFPNTDIRRVAGHIGEVFVCSWSPVSPYLVGTGSGDGTVRIWTIPESSQLPMNVPVVLPHIPISPKMDITSLEWSPDGEMIASGSYDRCARLFNKEGALIYKFEKHQGPVFALKWSPSGRLLVTASADETAIIWDVSTGEMRQEFAFHSAPTLDVSWRDDVTFATCSVDQHIYVCQLGTLEPLMEFSGHSSEVNGIRWDPTGKFLASCSDDKTCKIFSMDKETPVLDLTLHTREVYMVRWAPDPAKHLVATASFDGTIRIWDNRTGVCKFTLQGHVDAVYSIAFNQSCTLLASGSADKNVNVWSLEDGTLKKQYVGESSIYEVGFNLKGDMIAASTSDHLLVIFYLSMGLLNTSIPIQIEMD